jgi:hypothetical protein
MMQWPFCQYANEDGALFCEQCKSDLGILEAAPSLPVHVSAVPAPMTEASPFAEASRPIPVATPIGQKKSPAAEPIPVATAVAPIMPVPLARAVDQPPAALPQKTPGSTPQPGVEPPPTVPFSIDSAATFRSVETFSAPSQASRTPLEADPANSLVKDTDLLPIGGKPRLLVLRGQKINVEYPLYDGDNYIGRADERPVDIDLEDQEPPDRIWSSRQHALIRSENGTLVIEDLNSSNGTFVNRTRLYPGQKRVLNVNDIIQIGTVQMKVLN